MEFALIRCVDSKNGMLTEARNLVGYSREWRKNRQSWPQFTRFMPPDSYEDYECALLHVGNESDCYQALANLERAEQANAAIKSEESKNFCTCVDELQVIKQDIQTLKNMFYTLRNTI